MRTIKYRGWDVIGGKWVYGDLVHNQKVTRTGLEPRVMVGGYEVDPDSVGQFTGKHDIHRKEVYEGDAVVVRIHGGENAVAIVTYDEEMCAFLSYVSGEGGFCMSGECEVIGNKYHGYIWFEIPEMTVRK